MIWKGQLPLKKLSKLTFTFEEKFGSWNSACGIIRMIILHIISLFFPPMYIKGSITHQQYGQCWEYSPKMKKCTHSLLSGDFAYSWRAIFHVHRFYLNWHIPWKIILYRKLYDKPVVIFKFQLQHCTALIFSSCESRWFPQNQ